jgi:cytoskeletal protein CcmA (bactofilin family)
MSVVPATATENDVCQLLPTHSQRKDEVLAKNGGGFVGASSPILKGAFMFTRSSSAEPTALEPRTIRPANTTQRPISAPSTGEKSVIGNDLKIIGVGLKILSRGILQVDGEIEGDVQAAEVIVGEKGKVTGMVAGRQIVVRGKVSGVVLGQTVALQASSQVEGDIHHMSLLIEQGAMFEGRSRRAQGEADLVAVADQRTTPQSTSR